MFVLFRASCDILGIVVMLSCVTSGFYKSTIECFGDMQGKASKNTALFFSV